MIHQLQVEAIAQGTVIDHIPAGKGLKIIHRLQLKYSNIRLTIGLNLPSGAMNCKDLIKINALMLSQKEAAELALFAPEATLNIIDNYAVVQKFKMAKPERLQGVFACPNPNCITHCEPVSSLFLVRQHQNQLRLRCHYCERSFSEELFS